MLHYIFFHNKKKEWQKIKDIFRKKRVPEWIKKNNNKTQDFPDGPLVKNPPANEGDTGWIPGMGRYYMPQSN